MKTKTQKLNVGDRVRFTADFCRNTGNQTGDIPFARGVIEELKPFSHYSDTILATIKWNNDPDCEMPHKVITANLETY